MDGVFVEKLCPIWLLRKRVLKNARANQLQQERTVLISQGSSDRTGTRQFDLDAVLPESITNEIGQRDSKS